MHVHAHRGRGELEGRAGQPDERQRGCGLGSMLALEMDDLAGKHRAVSCHLRARASALTPLFLALSLALLWAPLAHAQEGDVVAAANAFQQAQRAELSGDLARAAELYELADRIAPTPEALRNATRSRLNAGQMVAAATHAEELLGRYGEDPASVELAQEVLRRARPELGRLQVSCDAACTLVIDGLAGTMVAGEKHVVYLKPGAHQVVARFAEVASEPQAVTAAAGSESELSVTKPAVVEPPPVPPAAEPVPEPQPAAPHQDTGSSGLHPAYFWSLAGVSLALGAVTIWSGVDLLHARDEFKAKDHPTHKDFEDGEKKDMRTSILLGVTGGFVAGSIVTLLFTDFGGERLTPSAALDQHGGMLGLKGRF